VWQILLMLPGCLGCILLFLSVSIVAFCFFVVAFLLCLGAIFVEFCCRDGSSLLEYLGMIVPSLVLRCLL